MIVVSNTTPIIYLAAVGQLEVLRGLFGDVFVPEEVYCEFKGYTKTQADSCRWIKKVQVQSFRSFNYLTEKIGLHPGEASAIVSAVENKANYLLMDETHGRKVAKGIITKNNLGLKIASLPILIQIAGKRKIISNPATVLFEIFSAGYKPSILDQSSLL